MLAFPNIKINLGLSITEKRPDGYHNLETVFYPVALEDALEIRTSSETEKKDYPPPVWHGDSRQSGRQPGGKGLFIAG